MTVELVRPTVGQRRCALYRHFDDQDVLLYVGITDTLGERTNNGHARSSDWVQFAERAEAEWYDSREEASAAEREAVRGERPVFNRQYAEWDVDQQITAYLHERKVRLLNDVISLYEQAVKRFLTTVPDRLLTEAQDAARELNHGSDFDDERVRPALVLDGLNFAASRRSAVIRENAAVSAFQEVLDFVNKRVAETLDPWAAADEEPPF